MRKQKQRDKLPFEYYSLEELMTVKNIFYHPVRRTAEGITRLTTDKKGDFYSVYGHFPEGDEIGPSMCLYDCATEKEAADWGFKITSIQYYYRELKSTGAEGSIQVIGDNGKSKWLYINKDSIKAIKMWLRNYKI